MAGNYQQTIILGTVGSDPDSRFLQSGTQVTNFSVAVNEYWTDQQTNERRERTTWYRCNCWGKQAEVAKEYVGKGMQIMIQGTVSASAYVGNDGEPKASLELKVAIMQFVGSRGERQEETQGDGRGYNGADLDSIPF